MDEDRTEDLDFLRTKGYEIQREPNDMYTVYEPGADEPSKVKGADLSKAAAKLRGDKVGSKKGKAASADATTTTTATTKGTDADMNTTATATTKGKPGRASKKTPAAAVTPAPPAAADAAHDEAVARADAAVAAHRAEKGSGKKSAAKRAAGKGGKPAAETASAKQASTPAASGKGGGAAKGAAKGAGKGAAKGGTKKAASTGEAKPVDNSKVPEVASVVTAAGLKPLSERAGKVANPDTPKGRAILDRINRCTEQTPLMASELTSFEHELARRWFAAGACERVRKEEGGLGYYKKKTATKK